ncbi:SseB family protein [Actinacidiphila sp. ITFR-21]|uniref:SseB family protein n=1 Tax=Actinacidiphila sp. ITFR-21 TaxID=3075199 RepID=UPI002889B150|nr:SseB family protein [Streptomyces sp. ITFR-21]WNI14762.1 SseB family protein [Streptomyces sp. ITFR-21]
MALKNIPDPGFADDDGSAAPALAAALAAYAGDRGTPREAAAEQAVVGALHTARLLVPVVALLGEAETGPDGLRRDKTSDMAVPTIQAPDGRRALPAFTSTASLARWRPDARPVAVPLARALQALAHEGADTLLVDLAGPVAYELTGPALRAAVLGPGRPEPLANAAVRAALRAAVAAQPGVVRAHLATGRPGSDGTLGLVVAPGADVETTGRALAAALAADEVLRAALVQGLDLALLPPDAAVPGPPLFGR